MGDEGSNALPFAGGSGAGGVSIQPVAFLVVGNEQVRLLPVDSRAFYDRLIDLAPQVLEYVNSLLGGEKKVFVDRREDNHVMNQSQPRQDAPPQYNPQGRK